MQLSDNIKKKFRILHRWMGLITGALLLVVAITGSIMAFEEEGREYFQHDYYHLTQVGEQRLPVDKLIENYRALYPKLKINSLRFRETKDAAFVFFTKERYVFMDPYTGRVTLDLPLSHDFFTVVRLIHTELYMGEFGKTIIHINVLIFTLICISGLVIWWPKKWKFFRQAVSINTKNGAKRTNYDLHRALGFYAMPVFLIICFTGLFMAFDTTKNLVSFVTGNTAHDETPSLPQLDSTATPKKKKFSVDQAYQYAAIHYPGAAETFLTPGNKTTPIRVVMRYPFKVVRQQNTIYFDQRNGNLLRADLYTNYNSYDIVAKSNYNLHTGKIRPLGIFSKLLYFLAALAAASLPITGLRIWLGRKKKKTAAKPGVRSKISVA